MLTILALYILTPLAQTSSLHPRKIFDPYIVCHNPLPPMFDFPAGCWSRGYRTTMDLCSAANGRRHGNMGCFCSSAHTDLDCDTNLADPLLVDATTSFWNGPRSHPETFTEYCSVACYCADTKSAAIARASAQRNSELNRILNNGHPPSPSAGADADADATASEPSDAVTTSAASFSNLHCGGNCSSNADCLGTTKGGCTCRTQKEQYVPAKGAVMFAAACIISLGGKREEQRPCPCNVTYVSHACCGAVDGIVREEEGFKLGEVLLVDEL